MKGMTLIVKEVTKLVSGFIFLYSIYIVLYGHITPGGGFAGGVILACGLILLMLAFGKEFASRVYRERGTAFWDVFGALAFLLVALLGYAVGHRFFGNFLPHTEGHFRLVSAGIIPICNLAIGIKVGAGLGGAFLALVFFRMAQAGGDKGPT